MFSSTLTNEFIGAFTYIGFPNTFVNPAAIDRFKLGYPYHGFFNNGIAQIPNILSASNQTAVLSNNGGFAAGGGTLFANKPLGSIADNVANLETPGYLAKRVSFEESLASALRSGDMSQAQVAQTTSSDPVGPNGNNVQLDRELLQMSRAAAEFSAAQTALLAKFRLIRYAISESK